MEIESKNFNDLLIEIVKQKKIAAPELAYMFKQNANNYYNWLAGKTSFKFEKLEQIALMIGVKIKLTIKL